MSLLSKIILIIGSIVLGYSIGVFIASRIKVRKDEEIAKAIIDHLQMENELAQKEGSNSIIDYVIKTKGMEYAVGFFGETYMIMDHLKDKTDDQKAIESSLREFLKVALKPDIQKFQKEHKELTPQDKVSELKNKIYQDLKK